MKELKVSFNATICEEYKDVQVLLQEMKKVSGGYYQFGIS